MTIIRGAVLAGLLALTACSGIDFGDRPGREVPKETGPLTNLPLHLKNGGVE